MENFIYSLTNLQPLNNLLQYDIQRVLRMQRKLLKSQEEIRELQKWKTLGNGLSGLFKTAGGLVSEIKSMNGSKDNTNENIDKSKTETQDLNGNDTSAGTTLINNTEVPLEEVPTDLDPEATEEATEENSVNEEKKGGCIKKRPKLVKKASFGSIMGNSNIQNTMSGVGNAATAISVATGGHNMYGGPKGGLTLAIDLGWDSAANMASQFGAVGSMVGGIMKAAGMANKIQNAFLGSKGVDNMTTKDAVLSSPLGFVTGLGLVNALGGSNALTITKNEEVFSTVGGSYGGTENAVDDALTKSGKRYGLFSGKDRQKADEEITEAKRQQVVMSGIADNTTTRNDLRTSMTGINANSSMFNMAGGYQLANVHAAKYGMRFERAYNISHSISRFLKGGKTENKPKEKPKARSIEELIEYAKLVNPRFILRLSEKPRGIEFIDEETGEKVKGSHLMASKKGTGIVFPLIQEIEDGTLKKFSFDEAYNRALLNNNYLLMTPEEADLFGENYKQGWPEFFNYNWEDDNSIIENLEPKKDTWEYKSAPDVSRFQKGGEINLIPEGALHARKHDIDIDNITKKGIPVVSESKEGSVQQQAEIERDEIILRLELTELIEKARKKFESDELSLSEKDGIAIEIGKILANEILYNTQDNTGLINETE